ncbi:MAG TPA: hypothetical protein VJ836_03270 [Candidatus Saccharimonadales bacterium]|nr:hypothetical protein [Candidatus Saccharimonadales bacterium]
MKKLLIAGATLAISLVPTASAAAHGSYDYHKYDKHGSKHQRYYPIKSKQYQNSYEQQAYYNKTVSYQALYYVNYKAAETAYYNKSHDSSYRDSYGQHHNARNQYY